jgi:hypothetical protein
MTLILNTYHLGDDKGDVHQHVLRMEDSRVPSAAKCYDVTNMGRFRPWLHWSQNRHDRTQQSGQTADKVVTRSDRRVICKQILSKNARVRRLLQLLHWTPSHCHLVSQQFLAVCTKRLQITRLSDRVTTLSAVCPDCCVVSCRFWLQCSHDLRRSEADDDGDYDKIKIVFSCARHGDWEGRGRRPVDPLILDPGTRCRWVVGFTFRSLCFL